MPLSEFVIAVGSKALFACLSQYIKYQLKNEGIEKQIITSVTDTFIQGSSDSIIKKITKRIFPEKTFQKKYAKICSDVFNNLINCVKYEKVFEEWFEDFKKTNEDIQNNEINDIETSLRYWFDHHTSLAENIDNKINDFISDFNSLTEIEIQKDHELATYFECYKNAKSIKEIEDKLAIIENDINKLKDMVSDGFDEIKTMLSPNKPFVTKIKYPLDISIIERKVIPYNYIQESTEYFHKVEAKPLLEYCKEERLIVLLGDAGCGKTTVLTQLAAQAYDTDYYPLLISLSNYAGESIEELIQRNYTKYDDISLVLIFDAFDETRQEDRDIFARKINSYIEYRKNDRIVISVRNNFYKFNDADGYGSTFNGFNEMGLCPLDEFEINDYVTKQGIKYDLFKNQIISNKLNGLVCNPFYLDKLTSLMLKHGILPPKNELMETIIDNSLKFDSNKYRNPDIINKSKVKLKHLLQKIAFSMQLMKDKSIITTNDYQYLLENESDRELLEHSSLFTATNNEQWRFEHNNFREYLAAKYLDQLDFETIKDVLCSDKEHKNIRESWLNVISYLVIIHDEDDLLEWLTECSPELLVKFENSRIDEDKRSDLLIRIFNYYTEKNMYITWSMNTLEELARFGKSQKTSLFLTNSIENGTTIFEKANAIKLISNFGDKLYNNEDRIRKALLQNILGDDDYIKAISIEAMGKLKLGTSEITDIIINQLDNIITVKESDDDGYIKYMIVKYFIESDLYENYIDLLLNIYEQLEHDQISHSTSIAYALQDIYPKIDSNSAVKSLIKYFAKQKYGFYKDEYYKLYLKKAIDHYNNGDVAFIDVVIEAMLDALYRQHSAFFSVFKNFFIKTGTLTIALEKLLSEQNADNKRVLRKVKFFKLFYDNNDLFNIIKTYFYADSEKNEIYVDKIQSCLKYGSSLYNKYCKLLNEKGFSLPQPPLDFNRAEQEGLQAYFNSLFSQEEFQKMIEELINELNDDNLTYDNVDEKFFDHFKTTTSQSEKLHHVILTIKCIKTDDKKIKNFITHINNWELFCIHNIVNTLSSKNTKIMVSDEQRGLISDYCKKVESISIRSTNEIYYFCFLSNYFDIEYDIDTYKKMTRIPNAIFNDDSHDNQPFPKYITEHLNESELNECVRNNLESNSLCTCSIINHINYCKEKMLDFAIDAAEAICLNVNIPDFYKKDALEYLIAIKHDDECHYNYIYNKFLETDDIKLLNALIQTTMADNNIKLVEKLELHNSKSPDKTTFLIPLINMQSNYALQLYYTLAKEKMTLPDYNVDFSEITDAISNVKSIDLLPNLLQLKDLIFLKGFKDKENFGLRSSLWKSFRNISDNNPDHVIDKLQECLQKPDISDDEKSFCNSVIAEIESSKKYRADKAWNLREIKKFLKEHDQ